MDQQNPNPTPKRVLTAEEIARLEAEAVAAMQRGEQPAAQPAPETAPEIAPDAQTDATKAPADASKPQNDFVPYVDDVVDMPKPQAAPDAAEAEDDDDEEYIPSVWEKRVDALTPKQWKWTQIGGGAVLGFIVIGLLGIRSEELATYRLIIAALVALLLPRYLERVLRRKLITARYAMIAAMVVGLIALFLITGLRNGFNFTTPKQ